VIWVFDYFLYSCYRYIIYTHSCSNLCHSNVTSTYYVSKKYLNNLTSKNSKMFFICQTSKSKLKIFSMHRLFNSAVRIVLFHFELNRIVELLFEISNIRTALLFKSGKTIRLQWDFCRSRISVGFGKSARFQPEPKSGRALLKITYSVSSWDVKPV